MMTDQWEQQMLQKASQKPANASGLENTTQMAPSKSHAHAHHVKHGQEQTSQFESKLHQPLNSAPATIQGAPPAVSAGLTSQATQHETPSPHSLTTSRVTQPQPLFHTTRTNEQPSREQNPRVLPSEAELRARIPPEGITPYDLWCKYKDRIVDRELLSQYEHLIKTTTLYKKKEKVLVARAPERDTPLPTAAEVRARIPPTGIHVVDLMAVYCVDLLGFERYEEFKELLNGVSIHDTARDMVFPLPPPLPTEEELRSIIPPRGIFIHSLFATYSVYYMDFGRYEEFIELLDRVAIHDKRRDLFFPLPPPLPTAEELRSRIPPEGISVGRILAVYKHAVVGDERRKKFALLIKNIAKWDKERKLLMPLPPGREMAQAVTLT